MRKGAWVAFGASLATGVFVLVTTYVLPWNTTGVVDGLTTLIPIPVSLALGLACPRAWGLAGAGFMAVCIEFNNGYVNPFVLVVTLVPWFVGVVINDRQALTRRLESVGRELELETQRVTEEAVRLERARIARELHDVVAHSVSVMVVQAYAGERLAQADPQSAAQSFENIAQTATEAHGEIERLVELLADESSEVPSADFGVAMEGLVDGAVSAGLDVDFEVQGDATMLRPPAATVLYRVLQEGITNALKHAPGSSIAIRLVVGPNVQLNLVNGRAVKTTSTLESSGGGNGLRGLRERVDDLGGSFEVGPDGAGSWRLTVRVPAG